MNQVGTAILKTILVVGSLVFVFPAFANEHAAPAEHGEAPAEGAEGAEAKKPAAVKTCRWSEHESKLSAYASKIRSLEGEISGMIEHKHHLENSEQVKVLTQQISFKYKDLRKVIGDYESERIHVRFQHPDRDLEGERRYPAHVLKSLDEIEAAFGLDGRLDRIKRQVGNVFPSAKPTKEEIESRKPASTGEDSDDDGISERIRLVK